MTSHPLHEQIRQWRQDAGLTQAALAKKIGVELATVSRWERGINRPSRTNVRAIKDATQIEIAELPERAAVSELADKHYELVFKVDGLEGEIQELRERTDELTEIWQRLTLLERDADVADPEAVARAEAQARRELADSEAPDPLEEAPAPPDAEQADPDAPEDGEQPGQAVG